jgi:hypothetical protein
MSTRTSATSAPPTDRRTACVGRLGSCASSGLLLVAWLAIAPAAAAEDRITLRKPGAEGRVVVTGQIVEYSSAGLRLKPSSGGPELIFPADEVRELEIPRKEPHERALVRFREGEFAEAEREFEQALAVEDRAWMRRELLAELVRCGVARRNWAGAGTRFLALHKSDPGTHHARVIPLAWREIELTAGGRSTARQWLRGEGDIARLMGASWLLFDPEEGREAADALRRLTQSAGGRWAELAHWQLRRSDALRGRAVPGELALWEKAAGQLPADLQAGPAYLLGAAWRNLEEHSLAAAWWTRLTVLGRFDWQLAAVATREAGDALARIGQRGDAELLWREVVTEFEETDGAAEAAQRLRGASDKPAGSARPNSSELNGITP